MFLAPGSVGRIGDPHAPGQGFAFANAEAAALVARFTTAPTTSRKRAIDTLIGALKAAGVWSKLDALYLLAAADSQAARQNWVQDLYNLTAVSAPTFTADRGYAGDGASAYLNTGFNPTTASSPQFTLNSGHISAYDRTSRAADGTNIMGARESTSKYIDILARFTGNVSINRVSCGSGGGVSGSVSDSKGLFTANRSGASAQQAYKDGASLGSNSAATTGLPNASLFILARNVSSASPDAYTSDQVSGASIGGSLNSTEVAAKDAAILAYLQTVGAA